MRQKDLLFWPNITLTTSQVPMGMEARQIFQLQIT